MTPDFTNLREFFGDPKGVAIVCDNVEEFRSILDATHMDLADSICRGAVCENFSVGKKTTAHITLHSLGIPKWEGWCDEGWYESEEGIPEVPYALLRRGSLPEEPIQPLTEEELNLLWEGL